MYKFSITLFALFIVTIFAAIAIAVGGGEVVLLFLEFAVRVVFPCLVLAVAGAVVTQ